MKKVETSPHHFEHETEIVTSRGIFTASEWELMNRGKRTGEAVKLSEKESVPDLYCPFRGNLSLKCKREKCSMFSDGRCSVKIVCSGAEKTLGKWCPVCNMLCSDRCALNCGGTCGGVSDA